MPQATWVSVTLVRSLAEGGQLDEAQTVLASAAARRSVTLRHTRLDLQSSAHQESSPPVTLAVAIKRRVCRTMDLFASALEG
jgi:hypothetical protein